MPELKQYSVGEKLITVVEFPPAQQAPWEREARFAIADVDGNVLDDAQGYGYKEFRSALRAANFKFGGGKERMEKAKAAFGAWLKKHPGVREYFQETLENRFKELARGELTMEDVFEDVERHFGIELPAFVRKGLIR